MMKMIVGIYLVMIYGFFVEVRQREVKGHVHEDDPRYSWD